MPNPQEQIKALQYIFDVARTAPAPAAVHEQAQKYAQFLANSFNPAPEPKTESEKPKPTTVAEAVAEATAPKSEPQGGLPEA